MGLATARINDNVTQHGGSKKSVSYSTALMSASRITLPHLAISALM
jgi:hypothetical protein